MKYFFEQKREIEIWESKNLDFPAHLHEQIEIGYLERGSGILILDEKRYRLNVGDFFVVFPNQIHSYEGSEDIISKLFIFSPELVIDFKNLYSATIPQSPVIHSEEAQRKIVKLIFDLVPQNSTMLRGFLTVLFGALIDGMRLQKRDEYSISTLKNILIYCSEHFNEGITISDVSESIHISRYHIAHIFKKKLNTTFSDYITKKRIEYSCVLLRDKSLNITEIAYLAGFNSPRTFNRCFLKQMNMTPKKYRAEQRNSFTHMRESNI